MSEITSFFGPPGKYATTIKLVIIGVLILLLLIPITMISLIVRDREYTFNDVREELISANGGPQTFTGPVLHIPYRTWKIEKDKPPVAEMNTAKFLPETLNINGKVNTLQRNRGIYEITVFTADLEVSGTFNPPDFSDWNIPGEDIFPDRAFVTMDFPRMKALTRQVYLKWNDSPLNMKSNTSHTLIFSSELNTSLENLDLNKTHNFSLDLRISGGGSLNFLPLGNETDVKLTSSWKSPSFTGDFLPQEKELTDQGFTAHWHIPSIARGYPQKWKEPAKPQIQGSSFGVNLIVPVHTYLKTSRALKYSILFIALPFLIFFLFEIFSGKKIHPLQYLLVGFAVSLFYLLLLSFSEHLLFEAAYALAAGAVVLLISFYSAAILKTRNNTIVLSLVISVMYLFLYIILRSEDYALLIGSLGLFVILAVFMVLTRKIDWYNVKKPSLSSREEEKKELQ